MPAVLSHTAAAACAQDSAFALGTSLVSMFYGPGIICKAKVRGLPPQWRDGARPQLLRLGCFCYPCATLALQQPGHERNVLKCAGCPAPPCVCSTPHPCRNRASSDWPPASWRPPA